MVEKMGLLWKFFSLKHIKNLYLSSFLTQKSNFQSSPLTKASTLFSLRTHYYRLERGKVDLVNEWNSLDIDVSELN